MHDPKMLVSPILGIPLRLDKASSLQNYLTEAFLIIEKAICENGGAAGMNVPLMINLEITGMVHTGETLAAYPCATAMTLPMDLVGSVAAVGVSGIQNTTIGIFKNGINVGAIEVVSSEATFTFPDDVSCQPGDIITFVSSANASFDYLSVTVKARRNS